MYPYKDYTRIGGWLLVFVIWSGLQILVNLVLGFDLLTTVPVSSLFAILGHGCLRLAMLVLLFQKNRNCTKLLMAEAGVYAVEFLYSMITAFASGADAWFNLAFGNLMGSAAFYIGWVLYFQRSVRVEAYFSGVNPMFPPYGGAPYGQNPYGQNPYGQNPYGGAPYGGYPGQNPQPGSNPQPGPQPGVRYCPRCGRPVVDPKALFCANCGQALHQNDGGTPT